MRLVLFRKINKEESVGADLFVFMQGKARTIHQQYAKRSYTRKFQSISWNSTTQTCKKQHVGVFHTVAQGFAPSSERVTVNEDRRDAAFIHYKIKHCSNMASFMNFRAFFLLALFAVDQVRLFISAKAFFQTWPF